MSYPITNENVAGLLDALGRPTAADMVRWSDNRSDERSVPLVEQLAEANAELAENQRDIARLEALLCKRCALKWRDS